MTVTVHIIDADLGFVTSYEHEDVVDTRIKADILLVDMTGGRHAGYPLSRVMKWELT